MNQIGIIVMKSGYMDMIPMTLNALDDISATRSAKTGSLSILHRSSAKPFTTSRSICMIPSGWKIFPRIADFAGAVSPFALRQKPA